MPKPSARRFLLSACLLLAPVLAAAQAAVEKVPNVRTITVKAQGGAVSEAFVRGFVAFRAGEPFSREAAASTVRALYATGRFSQAVVLPRLDPATGEVDVEVVVEPRPATRNYPKARWAASNSSRSGRASRSTLPPSAKPSSSSRPSCARSVPSRS